MCPTTSARCSTARGTRRGRPRPSNCCTSSQGHNQAVAGGGGDEAAGAVVHLDGGQGHASAGADDFASHGQGATVEGDGSQVVHGDVDRGIGDTGLQGGVHGAAGGGVGQSAHEAAMHDANGVVDGLVGLALENGQPVVDLAQPHVQELGDGRGRDHASGDGAHELQAGHAGRAGGGGDGGVI